MKLLDYISPHGAQTALARAISAQPQLIGQWAMGKRPVPIERCVPIERATSGAVTRADLRPEDYLEIWPELADQAVVNEPVPAGQGEGAHA